MIARAFAKGIVDSPNDLNYFKNLNNCILDAQQGSVRYGAGT